MLAWKINTNIKKLNGMNVQLNGCLQFCLDYKLRSSLKVLRLRRLIGI